MLALFVPKISTDENEDLGSYLVRLTNRKNISLQQVADKAKRAGIKVERATLSKITSSSGGNPTLETLRGIAFGLEEPIEDVVAAAFRLNRDRQITRQITLRQSAWDALDRDATRCNRTPEEQFSAILSLYFGPRNPELRQFNATDMNRPNPAEVTDKLHEQKVDIDFATVLKVLNDDAPNISIKLKNIVFAAANLPLIEDTENGGDSHTSKGTAS